MVKTFRNNEGLRGSLFENISEIPTDEEKEDAFNDFVVMVDSFDSRIFGFVNVK